MKEDNSPVTFVAYVVSLVEAAAVHFGDKPRPGAEEPASANLAAAGRIIDLLGMLEEKTRGNLSAEERRLLEQALYELRMRYVQKRAPATPPQS